MKLGFSPNVGNWAAAGGLLVLALGACDRNQEPSAAETPTTVTTTSGTSGVADASSFFYRNEEWLEGLGSQALDLEDIDAVFWHVFSKLPDEVLVYPSGNYYYFTMYVDRRQIWGNIRLAAGRRENGVL